MHFKQQHWIKLGIWVLNKSQSDWYVHICWWKLISWVANTASIGTHVPTDAFSIAHRVHSLPQPKLSLKETFYFSQVGCEACLVVMCACDALDHFSGLQTCPLAQNDWWPLAYLMPEIRVPASIITSTRFKSYLNSLYKTVQQFPTNIPCAFYQFVTMDNNNNAWNIGPFEIYLVLGLQYTHP